jgi:hypothetical protein
MNHGLKGLVLLIAWACLVGQATARAVGSGTVRASGRAVACRTALDARGQPAANSQSPDPTRQDGRFITKLRWVSPHGEEPGTYAEYLQRHPLKPARFSNARSVAPRVRDGGGGKRDAATISILVDEDLYGPIAAALDDYMADLASEGYGVFLETVSGGAPAEIKAWVQQRHDCGSDAVVFVGDITAAWAEVSEAVFPCDLFYMDLDGHWEDADLDGDYEIHTAGSGDEGPEVYVARINARTLEYDSESNMVNGYLAKAHAYRAGALTQPWRGLEYVDEDWHNMYVALDQVYGDDVVRHDYGYFTTAAGYLDQMDLGQHFVQVCAHSYSGGHHFGTRPTESAAYAHVYVHSPSTRSARLLLGSDDGIKVWLNGANVLTRDVYQGWEPDQFNVSVTLNEGWNRLLCKTSQGGGAYAFSARITNTSYVTFPDLIYQISDPDTHGQQAPFIRGWLLNGFHQDSSDHFWSYLTTNYLRENESAINPQHGDEMGDHVWTGHSGSAGLIDLGAYCDGADYGVCYAFARVYAASDTSCQLWLGYDDGARVWLNGQVVLYDNRYGTFTPDMARVDVTLNGGENRLLVKVSEWMGSHGFSARFCRADGTPVDGLTYDPQPAPISYIGSCEANVQPSEGDPAPFGTWEFGLGSGYPFPLDAFYDRDGGWVFSEDVQGRDPPVLFYNLFACGPGRFTDANYLAGAYIFNTTYGLITVASAKSGSMLNFQDFTAPLAEGKTVGTAFREWFDAQAPFEQWEREWYYGMVLCGDPTLRPVRPGDLDRDGDVDLEDLTVLLAAYGACTGDPDFDSRADLDESGCVGLSDLATLLSNYGIGG